MTPKIIEMAQQFNFFLDSLKDVDKLHFDSLIQQIENVNQKIAETQEAIERQRR